jgi:CubicO group peptidase (beta-lactamase class C family)
VWELSTAAAELDDLVTGVLETADADRLAVVHDGAFMRERYGGEIGADSLRLSQSVGKSVLGLAVGILVGDGRLEPAVGR